MTILRSSVKCGTCKVFLYRNPHKGGDYIKGVLHSYCPVCGVMHGPESHSNVVLSVSKRKARKVAVRIASRYNLDFDDIIDLAKHFSQTTMDEFAVKFSSALNVVSKEEVLYELEKF